MDEISFAGVFVGSNYKENVVWKVGLTTISGMNVLVFLKQISIIVKLGFNRTGRFNFRAMITSWFGLPMTVLVNVMLQIVSIGTSCYHPCRDGVQLDSPQQSELISTALTNGELDIGAYMTANTKTVETGEFFTSIVPRSICKRGCPLENVQKAIIWAWIGENLWLLVIFIGVGQHLRTIPYIQVWNNCWLLLLFVCAIT